MRSVSVLKAEVAGMLSVAGTLRDIEEAREFVQSAIKERYTEAETLQSEIKELQRLLSEVDKKRDEIEDVR